MAADISNIKIGQSPQGVQVPVHAPMPPAPSIVIPTATRSGSLRKIVYGTLSILILGGIAYSLVSLFGGSDSVVLLTPSPTAIPSPSASPTTTPTIKNLRSYLGNPTGTITIQSTATAVSDFRNGFVSIQPTRKVSTAISVTKNSSVPDARVLLSDLFGAPPAAIVTALGSDWAAVSYGQTEQFSSTGIKSEATTLIAKAVFLFEVADATGARQAMRSWEDSGFDIASAKLFGYDTAKRIVAGFGEGAYQTIPVRYWNFPYADKSLDYAIVTASNNKNYLVIAASREAIFSVVDQLVQ